MILNKYIIVINILEDANLYITVINPVKLKRLFPRKFDMRVINLVNRRLEMTQLKRTRIPFCQRKKTVATRH